mmetsp:Transcript_28014/g.34096  ORF Transcript_28014/g.34096 Transcript_28014/m.34096 type:complete len:200 (-) Transcript_28014:38-637(-)
MYLRSLVDFTHYSTVRIVIVPMYIRLLKFFVIFLFAVFVIIFICCKIDFIYSFEMRPIMSGPFVDWRFINGVPIPISLVHIPLLRFSDGVTPTIKRIHIPRRQLKIVQSTVFQNTPTTGGLGNDQKLVLKRPPQQDLRHGPAVVSIGHSRQERIGEPFRIPVEETAVGLNANAVIATPLDERQAAPVDQRVQFDLIDRG